MGQNIKKIGAYAFAGDKIETIEINQNLTLIEAHAFRDNDFTSIDLKNVKTIKNNAFTNNKLRSVTMNHLVEIGDSAFTNNEISKLAIPETVINYGKAVFADNNRYVQIETTNPIIKTEVVKDRFGQVVNPVLVTVSFIDEENETKIISDEKIGNDYTKLDGIIFLNEKNTYIPKKIAGYKAIKDNIEYTPDSQDYSLTIKYKNISKQPIINVVKSPFIEVNGDGSIEVLKSFVTAMDFEGNDITQDIKIDPSSIDTFESSPKEVTYSVKDKYGNQSIKLLHIAIGQDWSNFPLGKGWTLGDFTYDGNKVTGFSASGLNKVETQKDLILPHLNPNDGSTVIDTVAIQDENNVSFRNRGFISVSDFNHNITKIEGRYGPRAADRSKGEFSDNKITSVNLPSLEYIGAYTFQHNKLEKIQFSKLTYIGDFAFFGNELSSIEENDLPLVEEAGNGILAVFGSIKGVLTKVHMPSLKKLGQAAFIGQKISDIFMPKLEVIEGNAFAENKITEVTPQNFRAVKILKSGVFRGNQISVIDLPTVVELGNAFNGNSIVEVKDNFKSLEIIGNSAFRNMGIGELKIPNLKYIDTSAFNGNPGLKKWDNKVVIWTNNDAVPSKENYIVNPKEVKDLDVFKEEDFTWDVKDRNKVTGLTNTGNIKLAHKDYFLELPDRTTSIGNSAFRGLQIKNVIGREVENIEESAFYANRLTDINNSFAKLKTIQSYAFANNTIHNLEHTAIEMIGSNSFQNNQITEIKLAHVKEIGEQAFLRNSVEKLEAPELIKIDKAAFTNHVLKELNLPKVEEVGVAAFARVNQNSASGYRRDYPDGVITSYGKGYLEKVLLPNVKKIKALAFAGNKISQLELPRVEMVERRAFDENALKELSLPNSIQIGSRAFGTNKIDKAYLGQGVITLDETAFRNNRNNNTSHEEVMVFIANRENPNNLQDGYINNVRQHIINPTKVTIRYLDKEGTELAESFTEYILADKTYFAINKFGYQTEEQSKTAVDNREENIVTFIYDKKEYPQSTKGYELKQYNEIDLNTGVKKERYYIGENMTTNIYFDLTSIQPNFNKGTIKIYYDSKFIDEKSITIPKGAGSIVYDKVKTSNGVYEIPLEGISGGFSIAFPINWKFNKYVTPNNYKLEINALFETNKEVMSTAEPIYLEGYYNQTRLTKMSPLNVPDYDYGVGVTAADNGPRLMGELSKYVTTENTYEYKVSKAYPLKYDFATPNLERYVDKAVLTEILPEYVAVKEDGTTEIRRAVFDEKLNPNWSLQNDGVTLIQSKEFRKTLNPMGNMDSLYLSFPDLKSGYNVQNTVSVELIPNDKGSKEENIIAEDDLSVYTAFYQHTVYKGDPRFEKLTTGYPWSDDFRTYFYDIKEDKEKVIPFLLRLSSMAETTDLRDVTITDYGLDDRLYYHGVSFPRNSHTAGNQVVTVLAMKQIGDKINPSGDEILFQKTQAMKFGDNITFDESYAKEIDYIHIILPKDHKIQSALEFHIDTKVREPKKKLYTSEGLSAQNVFHAHAVMAGNLYQKGTRESIWKRTDPIQDDKGVNVSSYQEDWDNIAGNYLWGSKNEIIIKEMNPAMRVEKIQTFPSNNERPVNPGEIGIYHLSLVPIIAEKRVSDFQAKQLIKEDLNEFKMIDIMPNAVLPIEIKMTADFQNSGGKYEIVSNYNGTGRNAILFTTDKLKAGVYKIADVKASVEPSTKEGYVTNELYATFKGNVKKLGIKKTPPNETGEWLVDQSTFHLQKVKEMYARGYVKKRFDTLWTSGGITTMSEEAFDYKLSLVNNVDKDHSNIEIMDFLPYFDDVSIQEENIGFGKRIKRGSEFSNTYDTNAQVQILDGNGNDVTGNYIISYWNSDTNINYNGKSADKVIQGLTWSNSPSENTKAIKIVSNQVTIKPNEGINIIIPMKAPKNDISNNYELTGKKAWNSFVRNDDQTIRFLEPNKTYNEMLAPLGSIKLIKYGKEGVTSPKQDIKLLEGAVFNLINKDGVVVSSSTSNQNGEVEFRDVSILGEYSIKEISASEGYVLSKEEININNTDFKRQFQAHGNFDIEIDDAMSKDKFLNIKLIYGSLELEKVNENREKLAHIKFYLEGLDDSNRNFHKYYVTPSEGKILVNQLPEGNYRLSEISNPEETGYATISPITFTIDKDHKKINFIDDAAIVNQTIEIIVNKVAVESGFDLTASLKDFTSFGLKKLDGYQFMIREVENPNKEIMTDKTLNGVVKVPDLKIDTLYQIEELKKEGSIYNFNPNKYKFKINAKAEVTDENGNVFRQNSINFPNSEKLLKGKVIVEKLDSKNKALEGAVFAIYKDGQEIQKQSTKIVNGNVIASFENLESGSYVLKEVTASLGYVKSNAEYTFLIPYKPIDSMIGSRDYEVAEDSIIKKFNYTYHNSEFEVDVIKGDTYLENVTLEFAKDFVNQNPDYRLRKTGLKNATIYKPLKDVTFELVELVDKGREIKGTFSSDKDGKVDFQGFKFQETSNYELIEKKAFDGYRKDNTPIKLYLTDEVKKENFDGVIQRYMNNEPIKGRIIISKYDMENQNVLAGAEFSLYKKDIPDKAIEVKETNDQGIVEFRNLDLGQYLLKETKAPKGYKITSEVMEIELTTQHSSYSMVINNYMLKTKVNVEKVWDDNNNQNGKRPARIEVILLKGLVEIDRVELGEKNNWKYTFDDLQKYEGLSEKEIVYTVQERKVDGYQSIISGNQKQGFVITNIAENIENLGKVKVPNKAEKVKAWVPYTGDTTSIIPLVLISIVSIFIVFFLLIYKKKNRHR